MAPTVRCSECGEIVTIGQEASARCPSCSALLNVTIDLESGRVLVSETVLVVDDEDEIRRVARALLEREGYIVFEASNGPDAALVAADQWPTFVLLDQRMPAMSGEDTSKLIRRIAPRAKIVAFSAYLNELPEWADALVRKDQIDSLGSVLSHLSPSDNAAPTRHEKAPPATDS